MPAFELSNLEGFFIALQGFNEKDASGTIALYIFCTGGLCLRPSESSARLRRI